MRSRLAIMLLSLAIPVAASAQAPRYAFSWGSQGSASGQFLSPVGVAVDRDGIVYVVDTQLNCVKTFSRTGTYLSQWQTTFPQGVALAPDGTVYVAGGGGSGISRYTNTGHRIANWLAKCTSIAVDADYNVYANVYASDMEVWQIHKFSSSGVLLAAWGTSGSGDGEFEQLDGIAVDREGNVYVADLGNHRVQKFTSSGAFVTKWGIFGSGVGELDGPVRIAIGSDGTVFVVDYLNNRVNAFGPSGSFLYHWGSLGSGPGQFLSPIGIAVDGAGGIYVADKNNCRIEYFSFGVTPTNLVTWGQLKGLFR